MAELTDEQIAQERALLQGVPRLNIGALFLPPIWGPAHGHWFTVLYYPIWLFADNMFYAAYSEHTPLSIIFAILIFATLVAVTVGYSIVSQPFALHRALEKGKTKEQYLRAERKWAVACVVIGIVMLLAATYYNLVIRPTLGM